MSTSTLEPVEIDGPELPGRPDVDIVVPAYEEVVRSIEVAFADHGVEVLDSPFVLSVDGHGVLELHLDLVRA